MARKAGQGKEEEESRARQQEEKTPVREEEEKPACHGGAHHVVEQVFSLTDKSIFSIVSSASKILCSISCFLLVMLVSVVPVL
ncbi:hypothetical protein STEG23_005497 [Scotinomys teguina]